jgi:hypothetical protein
MTCVCGHAIEEHDERMPYCRGGVRHCPCAGYTPEDSDLRNPEEDEEHGYR